MNPSVLHYLNLPWKFEFFFRSCIEFEPSYVQCEELYPNGRMSFKNFNPTVEVSLFHIYIFLSRWGNSTPDTKFKPYVEVFSSLVPISFEEDASCKLLTMVNTWEKDVLTYKLIKVQLLCKKQSFTKISLSTQ